MQGLYFYGGAGKLELLSHIEGSFACVQAKNALKQAGLAYSTTYIGASKLLTNLANSSVGADPRPPALLVFGAFDFLAMLCAV